MKAKVEFNLLIKQIAVEIFFKENNMLYPFLKDICLYIVCVSEIK